MRRAPVSTIAEDHALTELRTARPRDRADRGRNNRVEKCNRVVDLGQSIVERFEAHVFASGAFDPETYGAAIVPLIEAFVPGPADISPEEATGWAADQRELGDHGEFFFGCTQFRFQGTKSNS